MEASPGRVQCGGHLQGCQGSADISDRCKRCLTRPWPATTRSQIRHLHARGCTQSHNTNSPIPCPWRWCRSTATGTISPARSSPARQIRMLSYSPPAKDRSGASRMSSELVGVAGFEPAASSSRTKRAAKLRYTPPARNLTGTARDWDSLAETRTRSSTALRTPGHTAGEAGAEPRQASSNRAAPG